MPQSTTDYTRKNPLYSASSSRRKVALDLYEGGVRVEKSNYLTRHLFESDTQWNIRQKRNTYLNYAAPIVDIFAAFINEGRPPRELPDGLKAAEVNADRLGTTANAFFGDITRLAAAGGVRFCLVDSEPTRGKTEADNIAAGRRKEPYFVSVDADDVWDWELDASGLVWAVVHATGSERPEGAFAKPVLYETVTLWQRTNWVRFRRELSENTVATGYSKWRQDGEGVNPTGRVPLVPFIFEADSPMTGVPATDDVLSLILRIYQHGSEHDKMVFDAAVPLLVLNGLDKENWDSFVRDTSRVLIGSSMSGGISGQYIETAGSSFAAIVEAIDRDVNSVREIALRMVRPSSGVGESADSKRQDSKQLDTQLAVFARKCASSETQCWKIAAKWMGLPEEGVVAPYNEDYDVDSVSDTLISALTTLKTQGIISAETMRETKAVSKIMPDGWTPEEETARLARELGTAAGAGQGGGLFASKLTEVIQGAGKAGTQQGNAAEPEA